MKRILAMSVFATIAGFPADPQTQGKPAKQFIIDVPESRVEFYVGSSLGEVNGIFRSWTGQLELATPGVPESASLSLEISASSMTSGSHIKDSMVKGKKFFYVEKFPTISFSSTKTIPSSDPNKFRVQGNFTLRGVCKPVTLQVTLERDRNGGGQIYADLSFDRRDFGMTHDVPFVRVGDSVRVRMDFYVVPKPAVTAPKQ